MTIIIINILSFLLFFTVGDKCGHIVLCLVIWLFFAAITTMVIVQGEQMSDTKQGREQMRREKDRDEKEWNEWRYKQDNK